MMATEQRQQEILTGSALLTSAWTHQTGLATEHRLAAGELSICRAISKNLVVFLLTAVTPWIPGTAYDPDRKDLGRAYLTASFKSRSLYRKPAPTCHSWRFGGFRASAISSGRINQYTVSAGRLLEMAGMFSWQCSVSVIQRISFSHRNDQRGFDRFDQNYDYHQRYPTTWRRRQRIASSFHISLIGGCCVRSPALRQRVFQTASMFLADLMAPMRQLFSWRVDQRTGGHPDAIRGVTKQTFLVIFPTAVSSHGASPNTSENLLIALPLPDRRSALHRSAPGAKVVDLMFNISRRIAWDDLAHPLCFDARGETSAAPSPSTRISPRLRSRADPLSRQPLVSPIHGAIFAAAKMWGLQTNFPGRRHSHLLSCSAAFSIYGERSKLVGDYQSVSARRRVDALPGKSV